MLQFFQRIRQNLYFLSYVIYESFYLLFAVDYADTLCISVISDSEFSWYALSEFSKIRKKLIILLDFYLFRICLEHITQFVNLYDNFKQTRNA